MDIVCQSKQGASKSQCFALRSSTQAVLLALAALQALPADAQQDDGAASRKLERVEVTGSSIKRIESETSAPIQVITRGDILKTGATSASEIMAKLAANVGGLTDGASINTGGADQMGFNSANLRGIGTSSTLVLLNGRRLANFASPGDDAGVDLNNIPAAAIERVEVLLDGASAIYGTDAIGGVINFITRKDYQGGELALFYGDSQHGGAGKQTASISAGFGDVARDGFNVFGVFDVQQFDAMRSTQRSFIKDFDIPNTLGHLLASYPYPANVRLDKAQLKQLNASGKYNFGARMVNFSVPKCNPPASVHTPTGIGGDDACSYDYMQDTEIYPDSKKLNFLGRGVLQLNKDHQLFGELLLSNTKTRYVASPNRISIEVPTSLSPELTAEGVEGTFVARYRMEEGGNRSSEVESDAKRAVLGMTGALAGWDYDWAYNHSINKATEAYVGGYMLYDPIVAGIESGKINLFGPSSAAGLAIIKGNKINDRARISEGTMDSVDAKASRALFKLDGGDLSLALGAEFRRERITFSPSALLLSNQIIGDRDPEGIPPQATDNSRKVAAAFVEINAPFSKELEMQLALRHDHYQGVGGTTNPKLGLRWVPLKSVLMRASYGTGFRAPSLSELYRPTQFSSTSTLPDPVYCKAEDNDLSVCADNWPTERQSNPKLKPETSKQFSMGAVFEPHPLWSVSLDYWDIRKNDLISDIGDEVILSNLDKYRHLVTRDEDGIISNIVLQKDNRGRQNTSGFDLVADFRGANTSVGKFSGRLTGTLIVKSEQQSSAGDPYISNLGKFVNEGAVQRWRHRLSADWEFAPFTLTLGNSYISGYDDQNSAIDTNAGSVVVANKVKAYSLWDMAASYDLNKALKLRAGVQNLFDTTPPFSNQAYHFISGYDPSYTDPRGRFFYLSAQYKFR
jgi:iron complex outermembrane receptor protein